MQVLPQNMIGGYKRDIEEQIKYMSWSLTSGEYIFFCLFSVFFFFIIYINIELCILSTAGWLNENYIRKGK